jgi:AcrR family transcriptional regulator
MTIGHFRFKKVLPDVKFMARKQKEKSKQTMNDLMDSAQKLFVRKGYVATSVAEITDNAGYSKGNFYRYWASKDRLFLDILEAKMRDYREARDKKLSTAGSLEEVINIIWDFLEDIVRDCNWAKVFLEFTIHAARTPEIRGDLGLSQYRLSDEIFAGLISEYLETDFPAEKLGALNTVMFEGFMVHNALGTGVLDLQTVRDAAVTLILDKGLKK